MACEWLTFVGQRFIKMVKSIARVFNLEHKDKTYAVDLFP